MHRRPGRPRVASPSPSHLPGWNPCSSSAARCSRTGSSMRRCSASSCASPSAPVPRANRSTCCTPAGVTPRRRKRHSRDCVRRSVPMRWCGRWRAMASRPSGAGHGMEREAPRRSHPLPRQLLLLPPCCACSIRRSRSRSRPMPAPSPGVGDAGPSPNGAAWSGSPATGGHRPMPATTPPGPARVRPSWCS